MMTLWIAGGLLLAVCLAGCGDDLPMAAQSQQAESTARELQAAPAQQRITAQADSRPRSEAVATALQSDRHEQRGDAAPVEPAVESEADTAGENDSVDEAPAPSDLSEVPALVVADAEMRVRPGLPWRLIRRLAAGDEVEVLSRTLGWLRVRMDDCKGWVRSAALDLGEVDESNIIEEAPPPIIAEWQGFEYGVLGQSADAAEVRLLSESDEVVSAPKGEVKLLANDITVDDLPVLIGNETVVFPGDDFRAGQGKILPRADEWMWLPWGWLLAHNEEFIWQWRPETDELEFIRRPPGPAKLSPNGRHLAIATLCVEDAADCRRAAEVTLLPLDGSPPNVLRTAVAGARELPQIETLLSDSANDLHWSAMGDALMVYLVPAEWTNWWYPVVLLGAAGSVTYLSPDQLGQYLGEACYLREITNDHGDAWWMRPDNTIAAVAGCESDGGGYTRVDVVFSLSGEFLRTEPSRHRQPRDAGVDRIRSSDDGGRLGENVETHWSTTSRFALVVDRDSATLSVYDAAADRTRPITDSSSNLLSVADWTTGSEVDSSAYRRSFTWNVFWDEDRMAAVMPRIGNDWILGGLLLDPSTAEGAPFYYGWQSTWLWPCLRTGVWNPEGTLFHVMVRSPAGAGIGITAKDIGVFQSLVIGLSGEIEAALISARTYWYVGAPTRSEWSPDGDWFAVGGQQRPNECHFHP